MHFTANHKLLKGVSAALVMMLLSSTGFASEISLPLDQMPLSKDLSIPDEMGKIKESFEGSSRKKILYIQDAHDSLDAQKNIAKIIQDAVTHLGVKTVYEEGYEGVVPSDDFFGFIKDPNTKEKVSFTLMDQLQIGGAEYSHINRSHDFKLIGADNLELQRKNIEWYRRMSVNRTQTLKELDEIHAKILMLTRQSFPQAMQDLMQWKQLYEKNDIDLGEYSKRLDKLSSGIGGNSLQATLSKAAKLKDFNPELFINDIDLAETNIRDHYLVKDWDRRLYKYNEQLNLLKKLTQMRLTQMEYQNLKASLETLDTGEIAQFIANDLNRPIVFVKEWEDSTQAAIQFYSLAHQRDRSIERALKDFEKNADEDTAVLVYGGFHEEAIKQMLREKDISYQIISPKIDSISSRHQSLYQDLMNQSIDPLSLPQQLAEAVPAMRLFARARQDEMQEALWRTRLKEMTDALDPGTMAASLGRVDESSDASQQVLNLEGHAFDVSVFEGTEDLATFTYDERLGRKEKIWLIVKNLKQQAFTIGQIQGRQKGVMGGGDIRRYRDGLFLATDLSHDFLSIDNSILEDYPSEPTGLGVNKNKIAVGAGDTVELYDLEAKTKTLYKHPWFASIHTLEFSADGKRLLITSTGFDVIFEIDLPSGLIVWEWWAWDAGYDENPDHYRVTRAPVMNHLFEKMGLPVFRVSHPHEWQNKQGRVYGLPTKQRAEHLNSARYDEFGNILVTFFHSGRGLRVNYKTKESTVVLENLERPHGLMPREGGYLITDTQRGRFLFLNERMEPTGGVHVNELGGIQRDPDAPEWLQNTVKLRGHLFASIDIHRRKLWLIDVGSKRYRGLEIPEDWALQEVHSANEQWPLLSKLKRTSFVKNVAWIHRPAGQLPAARRQIADEGLEFLETENMYEEMLVAQIRRLFKDLNWAWARQASVDEFARELARKMDVDMVLLTQKNHEKIRQAYEDRFGVAYADIEGLAENLLGGALLPANARWSFFNWVRGTRKELDDILSAPTITLTGLGDILPPSLPHRNAIAHLERELAALYEDFGVEDPWGPRGLIMNKHLMLEKHMWTKPLIFMMLMQSLAQVYGALDEHYVQSFRLANIHVLAWTLILANELGGINQVHEAVHLQRLLHRRYLVDVFERDLGTRRMEVVYRAAIDGTLYPKFGFEANEDPSDQWVTYWNAIEGNEWPTLLPRHLISVTSKIVDEVRRKMQSEENLSVLVMGGDQGVEPMAIKQQLKEVAGISVSWVDYPQVNDYDLQELWSNMNERGIEFVNLRPELLTRLDLSHEPTIALAIQEIAKTPLSELLRALHHVGDENMNAFVVLHHESKEEKRARLRKLMSLKRDVSVADAAIDFLDERKTEQEFSDFMEHAVQNEITAEMRLRRSRFKMEILAVKGGERTRVMTELRADRMNRLSPMAEAYYEKYKTLSAVPKNVFEDPQANGAYFEGLGFELIDVAPLSHDVERSRVLVHLKKIPVSYDAQSLGLLPRAEIINLFEDERHQGNLHIGSSVIAGLSPLQWEVLMKVIVEQKGLRVIPFEEETNKAALLAERWRQLRRLRNVKSMAKDSANSLKYRYPDKTSVFLTLSGLSDQLKQLLDTRSIEKIYGVATEKDTDGILLAALFSLSDGNMDVLMDGRMIVSTHPKILQWAREYQSKRVIALAA